MCWEAHSCATEMVLLLCFETLKRLKGNFDYKAFQVLGVPAITENKA